MMAPEDYVSEEERLREEREAVFAAEAAEVRWSGALLLSKCACCYCLCSWKIAQSVLFNAKRATHSTRCQRMRHKC
jgi:hypothetical protein